MPRWTTSEHYRLNISGAKNAHIWEPSGRSFLDLTSGWNVANIGWQNDIVLRAFTDQASQLTFCPSWCWHETRGELDRHLRELVSESYESVGTCTGAEAIETALKIARRVTRRHAIVSFCETYHGSTLGALQSGGVPSFRGVDLPANDLQRFLPLPEDDVDFQQMRRAVDESILRKPHPAAVLLEAIFTNPGVIAGPSWFYEMIAEATASVGALLVVDEIGTGMGRTGRMFAFQHFGIKPDLIVMGKALGAAIAPISAVLVRPQFMPVVKGLSFDSTYAWNPPSCAAALATLSILGRERLVDRARILGAESLERLRSGLSRRRAASQAFGFGLEIAVRLDNIDQPGVRLQRIIAKLFEQGVFAERSRYTPSLLIMPPLTILEADLNHAVELIIDICAANC